MMRTSQGQGRLNSSKPRKRHSECSSRRPIDASSEYGAGNIGSTEVYGVVNFDFEASSIPDAVWHNLTMRREGLGDGLFSFYAVGDGQEFCLDITAVAPDGEMPVVGVHFGDDHREEIATDFGSAFLTLVQQELAEADDTE